MGNKEVDDFLSQLIKADPMWAKRLERVEAKQKLLGLSATGIAIDEAQHFMNIKRVDLGVPQQLGQRERVMGPADVWAGGAGLWDKVKVATVPDGQEWTFITAKSWNEATRVMGPVVWHVASRQPVTKEVFLPLPNDVGQVVKVQGPARVSFETRANLIATVPGECEWEFVATIRGKKWAWIWSTGGTRTADAVSASEAPEQFVPKTLEERIQAKMKKRWG